MSRRNKARIGSDSLDGTMEWRVLSWLCDSQALSEVELLSLKINKLFKNSSIKIDSRCVNSPLRPSIDATDECSELDIVVIEAAVVRGILGGFRINFRLYLFRFRLY